MEQQRSRKRKRAQEDGGGGKKDSTQSPLTTSGYERTKIKSNRRPGVRSLRTPVPKRMMFQETDPPTSYIALHKNANPNSSARRNKNDLDLRTQRFNDQMRRMYYQTISCKNCNQHKCQVRNLPCKHVTNCSTCAEGITECAKCQGEIVSFLPLEMEDWKN